MHWGYNNTSLILVKQKGDILPWQLWKCSSTPPPPSLYHSNSIPNFNQSKWLFLHSTNLMLSYTLRVLTTLMLFPIVAMVKLSPPHLIFSFLCDQVHKGRQSLAGLLGYTFTRYIMLCIGIFGVDIWKSILWRFHVIFPYRILFV